VIILVVWAALLLAAALTVVGTGLLIDAPEPHRAPRERMAISTLADRDRIDFLLDYYSPWGRSGDRFWAALLGRELEA
jgi:hypothetical protein